MPVGRNPPHRTNHSADLGYRSLYSTSIAIMMRPNDIMATIEVFTGHDFLMKPQNTVHMTPMPTSRMVLRANGLAAIPALVKVA